MTPETQVTRETHRLQPKLGRAGIPVNVDVRRLCRVMTVEVESVGTMAEDRRHRVPPAVPVGAPERRIPASGSGASLRRTIRYASLRLLAFLGLHPLLRPGPPPGAGESPGHRP